MRAGGVADARVAAIIAGCPGSLPLDVVVLLLFC